MAKVKLASGDDSIVDETDLGEDLQFTTVDDMVAEEVAALLTARPDWHRHDKHVIDVEKGYLKFYGKHQPGDRLVFFCTSAESWERRAGRAGILLLREGKIIAQRISVMN
jgi:hypothetical protein